MDEIVQTLILSILRLRWIDLLKHISCTCYPAHVIASNDQFDLVLYKNWPVNAEGMSTERSRNGSSVLLLVWQVRQVTQDCRVPPNTAVTTEWDWEKINHVYYKQGWHILRIIFKKSSPVDKIGLNWIKLDKSGEKWIKLTFTIVKGWKGQFFWWIHSRYTFSFPKSSF